MMLLNIIPFPEIFSNDNTPIASQEVNLAKNTKILVMAGCSSYYNNGILKKIDKNETIVPVIKNQKFLVPSQFLSAAFKATISSNIIDDTITVNINNNYIVYKIGAEHARVNEKEVLLTAIPYKDNDSNIFVPIDIITNLLSYNLLLDSISGLCSISTYGDNFKLEHDRDLLIIKEIVSQIQHNSNRNPFSKSYYTENFYPNQYYNCVEMNNIASGYVKGFDEDGDSLIYALKTLPGNGKVALGPDGHYTYTPKKNYLGLDEFFVAVSDGRGGTADARVRVMVGYPKETFFKNLNEKYSVPNKKHPRLVYTEEEFENIKFERQANSFLNKTMENIIKTADGILSTSPHLVHNRGSYRGIFEKRVANLAFAFKITKDTKYLTRLSQELQTACTTIREKEFWGRGVLDLAQILSSVALAYDLCYYDFSPELRTLLEKSVYEELMIFYDSIINARSFFGGFNNFTGIVNSGIFTVLSAMCDSEFGGNKEMQSKMQDLLVPSYLGVSRPMTGFNLDGAYYEGLSYGTWMTRHMTFACHVLDKVFSFSYPKQLTDNFYKFPEWVNGFQGGSGRFTFGEEGGCGEFSVPSIVLSHARLKNRPDYGWLYYDLNSESGGDWITLMYYDKNIHKIALESKPKKCDYYYRTLEVAVIHSDWSNKDQNSIMLYTGSNIEWHLALELGAIQLDALGTRWFQHIGGDKYSLPGYGQKRNIYRKRAEGRNTLVINPYDGPDQEWARGKITSFVSTDTAAYAIADITQAYRKNAYSVFRGVQLFKNKEQFLIQDEIKARSKSIIYSFFHTKENIVLTPDGESGVLIDNSGNRLYFKVFCNVKFNLKVMEAMPLPESPQLAGQSPNDGWRKLSIQTNDVRDITIALWAVPLSQGQDIPKNPPIIQPLTKWSLK